MAVRELPEAPVQARSNALGPQFRQLSPGIGNAHADLPAPAADGVTALDDNPGRWAGTRTLSCGNG